MAAAPCDETPSRHGRRCLVFRILCHPAAYQGLIFEDDDERPLVEPRPEINVVLNWFEELKQKVPTGKR